MEKKDYDSSSLNLEEEATKKYRVSTKDTILYGFGPLADQMSHQMFQFLVFTYYYAVAGIDVNVLTWAFVIFAIWDSVNDPLMGPLSDRTKSKMGKRRFWVLISIIPFGLANVFLFTVGSGWSDGWKTAYMIMIIVVYDTFYTIYDTNNLALFGEMFESPEERGRGNMWKNIMTILGVIIGFVLPTVFISDLSPPIGATEGEIAQIASDYNITGIVVGGLTIIFGFLFFKFGMIESVSSNQDSDKQVGILLMLKQTFSNFTFIIFCFANLVKWFVFKLLTTIVPLYAGHVLGASGLAVSGLLLAAFLSAMAFFPVMKNLGLKIGWRNGFLVTQVLWCIALIPFWFFNTTSLVWAYITMAFVGIGLAGAIYFVEPIMADLIDEDEVRYKIRRSGSYYGVNGLINRYSTILVFLIIALVLKGYGWGNYLVNADEGAIQNLVVGLKLLMTPISIAGNIVVILLLLLYPLHGAKLKKMQVDLHELRLSRQK